MTKAEIEALQDTNRILARENEHLRSELHKLNRKLQSFLPDSDRTVVTDDLILKVEELGEKIVDLKNRYLRMSEEAMEWKRKYEEATGG
jgi:predicted RNase H-like nuclease (RuvC/YqgF family)